MSKLSHVIYGIWAKKQFHKTQRNPSVWVFGEWFGERCCDNSKYFANYMASFHPEIKVKWVANCSADTSSLDPNIECLKMDSNDAQKALSECGVAIISQGFQDLSTSGLNYVSGAISVHLWHGVPWKRIGHDGSRKKSLIVKAYQKLSDYYGSTQWMQDYEDDEAGKFPMDLKRGVLSEDAVYDLFTENRDLHVRMLRLVTNALESDGL